MKLNNNTIKIWDLGFGKPPIGVGLEEVDKDPVTGEWRTDDFAVPYGDGIEKTLDETLDRAYIEVINDKREDPYEPFTPVYAYGLYWFVADDVSTFKKMVGGDKMFNHQITLTEPTKWLERFMVGTKTVTQPVLKEYQRNPVIPTQYSIETYYYDWLKIEGIPNEDEPRLPGVIGLLRTIEFIGLGFKFPQLLNIAPLVDYTHLPITETYYSIKIFRDGVYLKSLSPGELVSDFKAGNYTIYLCIAYELTSEYETVVHEYYYGEYSFSVMAGKLSTNPIDLLTVSEDLLSTVEPLHFGENPRFVLSDAAKDKLRGIIAPEFTFTSATLRECLDQVAKYVNCITRLTVDPYASTVYTIDLDQFEIGVDAKMPKDFPDGIVSSRSIEQYASALDSVVENMTVHNDGGAISDPGNDAFITLRTESADYRITEASGFVPTAFPIERLDKVEVGVRQGSTDTYKIYDITKYMFEASEYRTLSSYRDVYPFSKCFALCYTLGSKNITGLNFEVPSAVWQLLKKPAIVNIINHAAEGEETYDTLTFPDLLFRVTYVPVVSARVRARRNDVKTESVLNSNQASAKIDAQAYGRALRGELCRIGNNEKTLQYRSLLYDTELPECGQTYGDGYYISAVKAQINAGKMDVDISLTKDFNRLSSFIGVRQNIRIEEISKSLAYNRYIIAEDSLIITTDENRQTKDESIATKAFLPWILKLFLEGKRKERPQFCVMCSPKITITDANGAMKTADIDTYRLPVYAFGQGTSLAFTFGFADNYSAGPSSASDSYNFDENAGKWYQLQTYNRYCDLFGRFDYLGFSIVSESTASTSYDTEKKEADAIPIDQGYNLGTKIVSCQNSPYIIKKDARERIAFTYQVNLMGENGIIVYSNFSENMFSTAGTAHFVFLKSGKLSSIISKTPSFDDDDVYTLQVIEDNGYFKAVELGEGETAKEDYEAWFVMDGDENILFGANQKTKKGEGKTVYFVMEK